MTDESQNTSAPARLNGVRGMNDILPADAPLWRAFEEAVADTMRAYGYRQIRTPIVEHTRLFVRGIGEVTDIVEKEMYSFTDVLNGEDLTLRECGEEFEISRERVRQIASEALDKMRQRTSVPVLADLLDDA